MTRVLAMVAVVGFILSIACFAAATGLAGGPVRFSDWGHRFGHDGVVGWDGGRSVHRHHRHGRDDDDDRADAGPQAARELAWSGGDRLDINVPADVEYTQGPKASLSVSGPSGAVQHVVVKDGQISFDQPLLGDERLKIVMVAPGVTRFNASGSQTLRIEGYKQDRLAIEIAGSAHVTAKGEARAVDLDISGSGDADLGAVVSRAADVDIAGSGTAVLAPKDSARIDISGSGAVSLLTRPTKLETDISGSGKITQDGAPV
jgi:hypothetical protein